MDKPDKPEYERHELPRETFDSLVKELSESLTEGPLEEGNREARLKRSVSPRYEIRIQTKSDPIAEETRQYRAMAKEIDGRYDDYMNRIPKKPEGGEEK